MTHKEFVYYIKGIFDSEIEQGRVDALRTNRPNPDIHLIGPLKLINDALNSLQEESTQPYYNNKYKTTSAVQWLYDISKEREPDKFDLEQAIAMEDKERVETFNKGMEYGIKLTESTTRKV